MTQTNAGQFNSFGEWRLPGTIASWSAACGDVDGDGDMDVVLGTATNPTWSNPAQRDALFLNDGHGNFSDVTLVQMPQVVSHGTINVCLGDVDGDSDVDIVTADYRVSRIYLNDGRGAFTVAPSGPFQSNTEHGTGLLLTDFDGDSDLDVFVGKHLSNRLYLNDGRGVFRDVSSTHLPASQSARFVAAADIDSDGDQDIVWSTLEFGFGRQRVYLNDGRGRFVDATTGRLPFDRQYAGRLALGDVDGDGDHDLLMSCQVGYQNQLYLNDGSGHFQDVTSTHLPVDNDDAIGAWLVDIDRDGDLDAFILTAFVYPQVPSRVRIYVNDGTGRFSNESGSRIPQQPFIACYMLTTGDLDGDGDPEAIVTEGVVPNRVLLNLHHQLHSAGTARLGQPLHFDMYAKPGYASATAPDYAATWISFGLLTPPLKIPGYGTLHLDPATLVAGPVMRVPTGTGTTRMSLTVPNDPRLVGLRIYAQAGIGQPSPGPTWRFSNLIEEVVAR